MMRHLVCAFSLSLLVLPAGASPPPPEMVDIPEFQACRTVGLITLNPPEPDQPAMFALDVDLDAFPQAKCNDGSGAVFWVRRYETLGAQSVENQNKWWIHLPGGGAAVRGFGAADRYCTNASRMSTLDIDRGPIAPRSIAAGPPENRFRNWNHVFIYNCSSDRFVGAAGAVATSGQPTGASDPVDYTIHYNGAHILDAVLDTLKRHDGVVSYIDREGKTRVMPNLDAATTVIFAGEAAGATGVIQRADDVHASLLATNTNCVGESCDVDVGAVVDGAYLPSQESWQRGFKSRWGHQHLTYSLFLTYS